MIPGIIVVGSLGTIGTSSEHNNRVHDPEGISPTATAVAGGTHHIKILEKKGGGTTCMTLIIQGSA